VPDVEVVAGRVVEDLLEMLAREEGHRRDQDVTDVVVDLGSSLEDIPEPRVSDKR